MTKPTTPRRQSSRRRQRSIVANAHETTQGDRSCILSDVNANKVTVGDFVEATRRAMTMLMTEHGYSRERAVTTLRDAIRATAGAPSHPSDLEVFNVMQSNGLGVDEATSVLTVSHAVREMTIQGGNSAVALTRLINEVTSVLVPTTPVASKLTLVRHAVNSTPAVSVRILPVVPVIPQAPTNPSLAPPSEALTLPSSTGTSRKEKRVKTDVKLSPSVSKNMRPRADSLADVVSDKLSASTDAAGSAMKFGSGKPPMAPVGTVTTRSGAGKRLRSASDEARSVNSSPLHGSASVGSNSGIANSNKRSRRNSPSVAGNSNSAGSSSGSV